MKTTVLNIAIEDVIENILAMSGAISFMEGGADPLPVLTADRRSMLSALVRAAVPSMSTSLSPYLVTLSMQGEGMPNGMIDIELRCGGNLAAGCEPLLLSGLTRVLTLRVLAMLLNCREPAAAMSYTREAEAVVAAIKGTLRGVLPSNLRIVPHY